MTLVPVSIDCWSLDVQHLTLLQHCSIHLTKMIPISNFSRRIPPPTLTRPLLLPIPLSLLFPPFFNHPHLTTHSLPPPLFLLPLFLLPVLLLLLLLLLSLPSSIPICQTLPLTHIPPILPPLPTKTLLSAASPIWRLSGVWRATMAWKTTKDTTVPLFLPPKIILGSTGRRVRYKSFIIHSQPTHSLSVSLLSVLYIPAL